MIGKVNDTSSITNMLETPAKKAIPFTIKPAP